MPGMGSGGANPAVVAAFRAALLHQGLIALLIVAALCLPLAWGRLRGVVFPRRSYVASQSRQRRAPSQARGAAWAVWRPGGLRAAVLAEPAGRRLLRIGFGLLWLFDGILQAQPAMPTGMVPQVIEPTAADSPSWVQDVVNWGSAIWMHHTVPAACAAVWIQAGLGIWLLTGIMSRLAGLASVGWGLVVWVFGESFGGIFTRELSWLTGAPGAVLIYVVAGILIALPPRVWRAPRFGQLYLVGLGVFLAVMAGVQARPGTGYWQGTSYGQPDGLAAMVQSMSRTAQPGFLSGWLTAFGAFDQAHGFAVNLFVVAALIVMAGAFLSGRLVRPALLGLAVLCLADWVLVQDLGFLGGVGTDPNSMIPLILLATAGYLALVRAPAPEIATAAEAPPYVRMKIFKIF